VAVDGQVEGTAARGSTGGSGAGTAVRPCAAAATGANAMVDAEAVSRERRLMPLLVRAAALLSSTFIVTLHLCL
jgi:hypothetical protein